jgi:hypothetical protein
MHRINSKMNQEKPGLSSKRLPELQSIRPTALAGFTSGHSAAARAPSVLLRVGLQFDT